MRSSSLLTVVAVVGISTAAAAAPNLIVNGSFEAYDANVFQTYPEHTGATPSVSTIVNSSNSGGHTAGQGVTGWTSLAGGYNGYWIGTEALGHSVDLHSPYPGEQQRLSLNFNSLSQDGGNFMMLDGSSQYSSAFQQNVTGLTAGHTYRLDFDWGATQLTNRVGQTTEALQVSFGTDTVSTPQLTEDTQAFSGWLQQSFFFKASSASEVLSFLSVGGPAGLPPVALLDGVSLQDVPEPATFTVLGMGLLGLGLVRKRRAKTASI